MDATKSNTLLITGTNRGIGLMYVKQYAEAGWQVIACCRNPQSATELLALAKAHNNIQIVGLEMREFHQIDQLGEVLAGQPIDLLINNAGVYPQSEFWGVDYDEWSEAFKVNTMSTLKLAEVFRDNLMKAKHPKLIAMTSKMGSIDDNGGGGEYAYRSTKTALNMVVKSLAIDLHPYGIAVAALHPGWVRTDMGGPNGLIDAQTSVLGLRNVIENLSLTNSGSFIAYDGQHINW